MKRDVLILFAKQLYVNAFKNKAVVMLLGIIAILFIYAAYTGASIYQQQTTSRMLYQNQVRDNWEKMPDKHPHRMAHYGYIVFRPKHPLSFFDFGMESYTGNAVFLEAHRQNTINFSEAGFSTGMLRFGEISMAMILQVLVPLVIFFIGFNAIAADRENGTLKILLSQGTTWKEIITGKTMGLLGIAFSILLFTMVILMTGFLIISQNGFTADGLLRVGWLMLSYALYFAILCIIAVVISSVSKTAKLALVSLIGIWLLCAVILPKTTQAIGNLLYASPSRIEFATAIEKDLIKKGDSHDPDDPYYKALKDSVLKAYKADSVQQLPFNYSGFQMKEGERISSEIYSQHLMQLLKTYQQQNDVSRWSAFINPFAALRNISMAVSGTDFNAYTRFQEQAEDYRYRLAQHMNDLQIKLISNRKPGDHDKPYSISRAHWKAFPDFKYKGISLGMAIKGEMPSLAALLWWIILLAIIVTILSKKLKAI
jgi:ABC-2 type transport system permease protein